MTKKYEKYLLSDEWAEIKISLFEKRGKKCEICNSKKFLQIHHLSYINIFNEEPEDLIILCSDCHKKEHGIVDKVKTVKNKSKKTNNVKNNNRNRLINKSKKINYLNKKIITLNKKYKRGVLTGKDLSVNIRSIRLKIKSLENF